MDWTQVVITLGAAFLAGAAGVVGGVVGFLSERWKTKHQAERQRAEKVVGMYTDFLVTFQAALHANETWWEGLHHKRHHGASFIDTDEARQKREEAESAYRDAAWSLRLRERDPEQQERIESIAVCFDDEVEVIMQIIDDYPKRAKQLRANVGNIVLAMQRIHRNTLDLV